MRSPFLCKDVFAKLSDQKLVASGSDTVFSKPMSPSLAVLA